MYWYEKKPEEGGIVLSTRVRFARNLEGIPFPAELKEEERGKVFSRIREAFSEKDPMAVDFGETDDRVKEAYVQTHLASAALAKGGKGTGLLLSREGDVSVMVNEEDHLRLQVILTGKAIRPAFEKAMEWMQVGEKALDFAYRDGLGYLTRCPTNLGAAMRISVMAHLPAIVATGSMNAMIRRLNDAGFTVRGLFGEGSRGGGNIFQISNQMSRDKTPEIIVESFSKVVTQVEEWERGAKEALLKDASLDLEDRVFRALGILKYAKKMSYQEFISLYSDLRFGREAQMALPAETEQLDRLLIDLMPAPMLLRDGSLGEADARDAARAKALREALKERRKEDAS